MFPENRPLKPKFKDVASWEQAQLLMQPSLIRVIDNLGKQLETSTWRGRYEEVSEPLPGHVLHLSCQAETKTVYLWELCFRVCFLNYPPLHPGLPVEIDSRLFSEETGEVEWEILDDKTRQIVANMFASLADCGG